MADSEVNTESKGETSDSAVAETQELTSEVKKNEADCWEQSHPSTEIPQEHDHSTLLQTSGKIADTGKVIEEEQGHSVASTKEQQPEADSASQEAGISLEESSAWGWGSGWGSWGRSLITSSVSSVSDSAKALGRGLGNVVSKVEGTLGVPSPEELVESEMSNKEKGQVLEDGSKYRI